MIRIEKAKPSDARVIQEILYKTWLSTYPSKKYRITVPDIHFRFRHRLSEKYLLKRANKMRKIKKNDQLFLAKVGRGTVGLSHIKKNKRWNKLLALYVLPEYQGKGVGRALWSRAEKFFDPDKNVVLTVALYNAHAIRFYKNQGFQDTGKRPKFRRGAMHNGAIIPVMEMKLTRGLA